MYPDANGTPTEESIFTEFEMTIADEIARDVEEYCGYEIDYKRRITWHADGSTKAKWPYGGRANMSVGSAKLHWK